MPYYRNHIIKIQLFIPPDEGNPRNPKATFLTTEDRKKLS